jgi:hypothetical protein
MSTHASYGVRTDGRAEDWRLKIVGLDLDHESPEALMSCAGESLNECGVSGFSLFLVM